MKIIHNEKPNLKLPEFKVDMPLSKYLDENFITNLENTTESDATTSSLLTDKYNLH